MGTNLIEGSEILTQTPPKIGIGMRFTFFWKYYAAYNGKFLPKFRDNLSVPFSGVKKSENIGRLSRNVGKELSLYAA